MQEWRKTNWKEARNQKREGASMEKIRMKKEERTRKEVR